jgi:hypothetical protein
MSGLSAYKRTYKGGGEGDTTHFTLFRAFAALCGKGTSGNVTALYPGCHRHLTASLAFDDVTYVDSDTKVADTFTCTDACREYVDGFLEKGGVDGAVKTGATAKRSAPTWKFLAADFSRSLPDVPDESMDALLSLSAGIVSRPCARYVRPGGLLLASDAHSDARTAFVDRGTWEIAAVWDPEARKMDTDPATLARCFQARPRGKRGASTPAEPLTTEQAEESVRVGARARRSFVLDFEPMFVVFRKRECGKGRKRAAQTSLTQPAQKVGRIKGTAGGEVDEDTEGRGKGSSK